MAGFDQLAGTGTGPVHSELVLLGIYLMVICPEGGIVSKFNGQMLRRTSPSSLVELECRPRPTLRRVCCDVITMAPASRQRFDQIFGWREVMRMQDYSQVV